MSEPFLERLSRFTPDAGGLDRDSLFYAAGRNSARPNRGWIFAASLLASTQMLSLVMLWPRPPRALNPRTVPAANVIASGDYDSSEFAEAEPPPRIGLWSTRQALREPISEYRPAGDFRLIESPPPLRAMGPDRRSLLN